MYVKNNTSASRVYALPCLYRPGARAARIRDIPESGSFGSHFSFFEIDFLVDKLLRWLVNIPEIDPAIEGPLGRRFSKWRRPDRNRS